MTAPGPMMAQAPAIGGAEPAPALPRLLAGIGSDDAMSLAEHHSVHGRAPLAGRDRGKASALIERIERAGLRGRGGAAFPTATKMRTVASARRRAIVVANGAEGEPASMKDRTLLSMLPHLVLDGAVLAAEAVGADEAIICVCESARSSVQRVERAIEERERSAHGPALRLAAVPALYVTGHETALISHLNGRRAVPTFTPPMPFESGVRRRPTLVNNVETLAQIALIARHGSQWFRQLGTPDQPGSTLVTLSGAVSDPGVYEIEQGSSLSSLIDAAGGTTARPRAALLGGYAGTWIDGDHLPAVALSDEYLAAHGAFMGPGVVVVLGDDACPVAETARVARWLAGESSGQCGPCVHGLDAMATAVQEIAGGLAGTKATRRIAHLASLTRRRGACSHPDGSVNFILSAIDTFAAEFADHASHGRCDACMRPGVLPLPEPPAGVGTTTGRAPIA